MSKRKLLVLALLFLVYELVVWAGSLLFFSGSTVWILGFVMTVCGLTVLLVYVLVSRLAARNAPAPAPAERAPSQPKPSARPAAPNQDEDLNELDTLLATANERLAKSPALASQRLRTDVSRLPLYLLVGAEGTGKTSLFVASGVEPEVLAGEVYRDSSVAPTRLCNLWFAKGTVVAEASGRFFSEDASRWTRLLNLLKGKTRGQGVRTLMSGGSAAQNLRGVILCCDSGSFLGVPDSNRQAALARRVQERLRIVGEVFGADFPVYVVFTKADAIPYFSEYFGRITEAEDQQVLGYAVPPIAGSARAAGEVYADSEPKRLSAPFNALYYSLAEKRLLFLDRESQKGKRAAIYEFPRELKRIRGAIMQYLVDVFRPNALQPGPMLSGVYFAGVRKVPQGQSPARSNPRAADMATGTVADATRLFRQEELQRREAEERQETPAEGPLVSRWSFVSQLFTQGILAGSAAPVGGYGDRKRDLYRRILFGAAAAVFGVGFVFFLLSFIGNRGLLRDVNESALAAQGLTASAPNPAAPNRLEALESLREQLFTLTEYHDDGPPWRLRWGLYAGEGVLPPLRQLYFDRFRLVLLNDVARAMTRDLSGVPPVRNAAFPYDRIYGELKGYLTITPRACAPEQPATSQLLLDVWSAERHPDAASVDLARRQFDYYVQELARNRVPFQLEADKNAIARGREYLSQSGEGDRIYRGIVEEANRNAARRASMAEWAPKYRGVLTGPAEVETAFTKESWGGVQDKIKNANQGGGGESCVLGKTERIASALRSADLERDLRTRYAKDYIARWKAFVAQAGVVKYHDPADAAKKLEVLSDIDSPVLGLLFLTMDNTSGLPQSPASAMQTAASQAATQAPGLIGKLSARFGKAGKAAGKAAAAEARQLTDGVETELTAADIGKAFQPTQAVFASPPNRSRWVDTANRNYVAALGELQKAMQALGQASNPETDVNLNGQADKAARAGLEAVRQLSFNFDRSAYAINDDVKRFLEAPIVQAQAHIVTDFGRVARDKITSGMTQVCGKLRPLLAKYPFNPRTDNDASLAELAQVFAPEGGALWSYYQQQLAPILVKTGKRYGQKPDVQDPKLAEDFLNMFNRLAAVSEALFADKGPQPQMRYTLTAPPVQGVQSLTLNKEKLGPTPKQFTWPDSGVLLYVQLAGGGSVPFANYSGAWGLFQMMADADPRPKGSKIIGLTYLRQGRRSQPAAAKDANDKDITVRLEVSEFPGGVENAFDKDFFTGLGCPAKVLQ